MTITVLINTHILKKYSMSLMFAIMDYCYRIYQRVLDILYASQKYLMNSVSKQCELISIIKFLTKAIKLTLNEIVENLFQTINQI